MHHTHKHVTSQTAALQQYDYNDNDKYHVYAIVDTLQCLPFTALTLRLGLRTNVHLAYEKPDPSPLMHK